MRSGCRHPCGHLHMVDCRASSSTHIKPFGWETESVSEWKRVVIHVSLVLVSGHLCMVAVGLLLWNRVTMATSEERLEQLECTASSELQDCDSGINGTSFNNTYCDNSICLDGRHACLRGTLQLRWRRCVVEELEHRNVVLLCGSLARTGCSDGKGQDDGRRNEEREHHSGRAGVEQTAVLFAQPEHER